MIARARRTSAQWLIPAVIFLALALALRIVLFGNPIAGPADEQFYLLVGERLRHGALPYVDIWDRKPVGLFAIYAVWSALGASVGGDGLIAYQLAALLCAVATALLIGRLAREIAVPGETERRGAVWWPGVLAGAAYLFCLAAYNCYGGQTPVFYNLPMAGAALLTCRSVAGAGEAFAGERLLTRGAMAMLLVGLAVQIKYSAIFEGTAFGLALLWRAYRIGWRLPRVLGTGLLWTGLGLAPTLVALACYAALGQAHAFIFANFLSIFLRSEPLMPSLNRLAREMAGLLPFWLLLAFPARRVATCDPAARNFLRYWALAAMLGFLVFGSWYDHYVAPMLVPLCVLVAPVLGRRAPVLTGLLLIASAIGAVAGLALGLADHGTRAQAARATALIQQARGNRCFYEYEGDPILYLTTDSCLATRYIFFTHLMNASEQDAIGVDTVAELTRTMATHPGVVMIATVPQTDRANWRTRRLIRADLARDYRRFATIPMGMRQFELYRPRGDPGGG